MPIWNMAGGGEHGTDNWKGNTGTWNFPAHPKTKQQAVENGTSKPLIISLLWTKGEGQGKWIGMVIAL